LLPLLERLQDAGADRDKAGNRQLFFDQDTALLLLYFFNPRRYQSTRPATGQRPG
jgi:hypothetical protein